MPEDFQKISKLPTNFFKISNLPSNFSKISKVPDKVCKISNLPNVPGFFHCYYFHFVKQTINMIDQRYSFRVIVGSRAPSGWL